MLLEVCASKPEAEEKLHIYAKTLKNMGVTQVHRVYVKKVPAAGRGRRLWGIYKTD